MDNSNCPCGLFIVLSGDLWLTGAFPAAIPAVCGVWQLGYGVRQFCWVGQLSIGGCVVLLAEFGRWEERRNDGNDSSGGIEGWRLEGFFSVIFFRPKELTKEI